MTPPVDKNCLSFWFPKIAAHGLPVPRTSIVLAPAACDLTLVLDGQTPKGFDLFHQRIVQAVSEIGGAPCFLRTGYGSGKHDWTSTCYVSDVYDVLRNVAALVEWSALVDVMGLPTRVWAVRELIDTEPLFHAFRGMPITREFRAFADDDGVETILPYWPPSAITRADREDWHVLLHEASSISFDEYGLLEDLAQEAVKAVGSGYWSVDFLQDREGMWWLTDMADGERSYKWTEDRTLDLPIRTGKYAERLRADS